VPKALAGNRRSIIAAELPGLIHGKCPSFIIRKKIRVFPSQLSPLPDAPLEV
jgi:hypothetical protein